MTLSIVDHFQDLQKLIVSGTSCVVVTLVHIRGSAPQVTGARAIVTDSGIASGTIGGGKIEAAAIKYAQGMLNDPQSPPVLEKWNLQTDIGMTCGGEVTLFFEPYSMRSWPIAVFGAGHVAQRLIRTLLKLECHVTCIDTRPEWLEKLPQDAKLSVRCCDQPFQLVASQPAETFFVLMSQGHASDLPVLTEILKTRSAPYVGVIGSRQKASVLRRELEANGISPELSRSFFCPMGLPIGNNTTEEIAISIAAQLIQVRDELRKS